jgi:SM-20-related protein
MTMPQGTSAAALPGRRPAGPPQEGPAGGPVMRLAARLDRDGIRTVYARAGRVHIAPILAPGCAEQLLHELTTGTPWQLHLNDGARPINLRGDGFEALSAQDRQKFLQSVYASAAQRFQYLYNSFPVSDLYERGEQRSMYLMRLHEFLNSDDFLGFVREVTAEPDIRFADAQATLYRPGHFLTRHDDEVPGKNRRVAYVLNLTPSWSSDWGGILQFIDRDGHLAEGYTPVFNALNLFRVPQAHAVSCVAPFAAGGRYSVTGWLRAGPRPAPGAPSH